MKAKLGITVGLLGAATYFVGLFSSGYIALILLAGYILLAEPNIWLRKTAVKAVVICMLFSIASALIGLIPNAINVIDDACNIFNGSFSIPVLTKIVTFINTVLGVCEKVLLLVLGFMAMKQNTIRIGFIDSLINKFMPSESGASERR